MRRFYFYTFLSDIKIVWQFLQVMYANLADSCATNSENESKQDLSLFYCSTYYNVLKAVDFICRGY